MYIAARMMGFVAEVWIYFIIISSEKINFKDLYLTELRFY